LFYKANQKGFREVLPGIKMKTLAYGEKTLFAEFRMNAGAVLPKHAHVHEQTGYLMKGQIRLTIGEQVFDVEEGDCWCVPGNMQHSAEIQKDSVIVEVFSPVREDYLPPKEIK